MWFINIYAVKVQNKKVTIMPIAGTRPRGKTSAEDKEFENDLLNDPKEKAEHLAQVQGGLQLDWVDP